MRAHYAHRDYVKYTETLDDSDDDEGPTNDDAWLYEDLTILAKLYSRLKDREQLIALIFEVCVLLFLWMEIIRHRSSPGSLLFAKGLGKWRR